MTRRISQRVRARRTAFGHAVRDRRKALGLSQEQLAELAGYDRQWANRIERGAYSPLLDGLWPLADALGLPLSELCAQAEDRLGHTTTDPARPTRASTTGTTRSPAPPGLHDGGTGGTGCSASSSGSSAHAQRLLGLARRAEQAQKPPTPVLACQPMPAQSAAVLRRGLGADAGRVSIPGLLLGALISILLWAAIICAIRAGVR